MDLQQLTVPWATLCPSLAARVVQVGLTRHLGHRGRHGTQPGQGICSIPWLLGSVQRWSQDPRQRKGNTELLGGWSSPTEGGKPGMAQGHLCLCIESACRRMKLAEEGRAYRRRAAILEHPDPALPEASALPDLFSYIANNGSFSCKPI